MIEKLLKGGIISNNDEIMKQVFEVVNKTMFLSQQLNNSTDIEQVRENLGKIIATSIDDIQFVLKMI